MRFLIKEETLSRRTPNICSYDNQSPCSDSNPASQYGEDRFLYYHLLASVDKQSVINVWTDRQTIMCADSVTARMLVAQHDVHFFKFIAGKEAF